jgi:hypothetical protein
MSGIVWHPPADLVAAANVTRLMRRHGIATAEELLARSVADPEWFWDAVGRDLGIVFTEPYHTIRDTSRGIPWTDWFVGGRLNLTANCLHRHLEPIARTGPPSSARPRLAGSRRSRTATSRARWIAAPAGSGRWAFAPATGWAPACP